jgi:hypothetical protein
MPRIGVLQHSGDANVAREEALEIQRDHAVFFDGLRVREDIDLAHALGFKIETRAGLRQRAQLEIVGGGAEPDETIAVKADLERSVRRFAIAHEIGHAVLLRKQPQAGQQWSIGRREFFANVFAAELLTTSAGRTHIIATFPSLTDPTDLLRLASDVGLSPHALLRVASEHNSRMLDKIWLRVKHLKNAFTQAEPRLRIVSAHYDSTRFFVATNQSVARFAGDDHWLSFLPLGTCVRHRAEIALKFKQPAQARPQFVSKSVPAQLSAIRLHSSTQDRAAYFIVLAELSNR